MTVGEELYTVKVHSCQRTRKEYQGNFGYDACVKCTENGEYLGKVIYPGTSAPLCTDTSFDEMDHENHHISESCPLKPLSVGCVLQFGLDCMQMVCLGVCRHLLLHMKGPVSPLNVRLGSRSVNELSQKLVSLCLRISFD